MSATFPFDTHPTHAGRAGLVVSPEDTAIGAAARRGRVPLFMPAAQEYFWHFEWQWGERKTHGERDAGETVRFDSDDPEDILDWLHQDDYD